MTGHQADNNMSLSASQRSTPLAHFLALEESLGGTSGRSALGQTVVIASADALSCVAAYPLALAVTRLQVQNQGRRNDGVKQKPREPRKRSEHRVHSSDDDGHVSDEYPDVLTAIREIYRNENGVRGLYAGTLEAAGKAALDSLIRVIAYTWFRTRLLKLNGRSQSGKLSVAHRSAVGLLAEALTVLLTTPIGTVVTRKQTQGLSRTRNQLTSQQIISEILSKEGPKGLWAGCLASLFSTLNVPLTTLVHEALQRILLLKSGKRSSSTIYLLWMISRATASSMTYPFSIIRARAQAAPTHSGRGTRSQDSQPSAYLADIGQLARSEGLDSRYPGFIAENVRVCATHGAAALISYVIILSASRFRATFEPRVRLGREMMMGDRLSHSSYASTQSVKLPGWGYTNATAALVGDYVEDEAEDWQSFYHWFWDPERRRNEN